jgi:hypothetical protein
MTDPRIENHAVGVELQLVELVDQCAWAEAQGRDADANRLRSEIAELQSELAATVEQLDAKRAAPRVRLAGRSGTD